LCQWRKLLKCFDNGLEWAGRLVAFENIDTLRVIITSDPHKIICTYKFLLSGSDGNGPFTISVRWGERQGQSSNADFLIRRASEPIARRIEAEIDRKGGASWGKQIVLGKSSLIVTASGREISYSDLVEAKLVEGFMTGDLLLRSRDGLRLRINSKTENFYPGYRFLSAQISQQLQSNDEMLDEFEPLRRRIRFVLGGGLIVVAIAILSLIILAPVDDFGRNFIFITASVLAIVATYQIWRGVSEKPRD
jgi:hypothetical protein